MRLPNPKCEQPRLFAEPLGNHGHVRTILGEFAEQLTAKLLGGVRYRTDSRATYCPDVVVTSAGEPLYFEVKAVGNTNATMVYKGRLERDAEFSATNKLYYVLWCHGASTKVCHDDYELRCWFLSSLKQVIIAPFSTILTAALASPLTKLNSKYGKSDTSPAYGFGYRIPTRTITSLEHYAIPITRSKELF